jgi:hypothetical protein
LLKLLDMQNHTLTLTDIGQKASEPEGGAKWRLLELLGHHTDGLRPKAQLDLPGALFLLHMRLMFEQQIQGRQPGWGVAQSVSLNDTGT